MNKERVIAGSCTALLMLGMAISRPSPAQPEEVADGQKIFTTNCGACHGSDGRGGERAPDIATRREVVARADAELIRAVQNGVYGTAMPAFGYMGAEKIHAVVHYLRTLQGIGVAVKAPGDPRAGEQLFYGKAECSKCHMINGRGGFIGSDLSGYGFGRSIENIRAAIVDPDRSLDRKSQAVTIVANNQQHFSGLVRNEDNFALILQTEDGAFHSFSKENIARIEYSRNSLMPNDYENKLTNKEIDNLVSYLLKASFPAKASAAARNSDDDDQ